MQRTNESVLHTLPPSLLESISIRTLRGHYEAEPPHVQARTLARVALLIAAHPQSYLAKHATLIYGRSDDHADI